MGCASSKKKDAEAKEEAEKERRAGQQRRGSKIVEPNWLSEFDEEVDFNANPFSVLALAHTWRQKSREAAAAATPAACANPFSVLAIAHAWRVRARKDPEATSDARCRVYTEPVESVVVTGYHGCPFFSVAATAAVELQRRGAAKSVVIRRGGQLHVPSWDTEPNLQERALFNEFAETIPINEIWSGSSPLVVVNGDPKTAMGGADTLVKFASLLEGFAFGCGQDLQASPVDRRTALAVVKHAFRNGLTQGVFAGDPPGAARVGGSAHDVGGTPVRFDDLNPKGFVYAEFCTDSPYSARLRTAEEYRDEAGRASDEATRAAASITARVSDIAHFPPLIQRWFKTNVERGTAGISEIIQAVVNNPETRVTARASPAVKAEVVACLESGPYREKAAAAAALLALDDVDPDSLALETVEPKGHDPASNLFMDMSFEPDLGDDHDGTPSRRLSLHPSELRKPRPPNGHGGPTIVVKPLKDRLATIDSLAATLAKGTPAAAPAAIKATLLAAGATEALADEVLKTGKFGELAGGSQLSHVRVLILLCADAATSFRETCQLFADKVLGGTEGPALTREKAEAACLYLASLDKGLSDKGAKAAVGGIFAAR